MENNLKQQVFTSLLSVAKDKQTPQTLMPSTHQGRCPPRGGGALDNVWQSVTCCPTTRPWPPARGALGVPGAHSPSRARTPSPSACFPGRRAGRSGRWQHTPPGLDLRRRLTTSGCGHLMALPPTMTRGGGLGVPWSMRRPPPPCGIGACLVRPKNAQQWPSVGFWCLGLPAQFRSAFAEYPGTFGHWGLDLGALECPGGVGLALNLILVGTALGMICS